MIRLNTRLLLKHHTSPGVAEELGKALADVYPSFRDIVFVCIGTDRSTGDSYGPFVGTFLEKQTLPGCKVYGTIDNPVHALNLEETLAHIKKVHIHPFIIGVDASLSNTKTVEHISFEKGSIKPGAAMKKDLPSVGEFSISGFVNVGGGLSFFVLQNTRLSVVMKLAEVTAAAITHSFSIPRKAFRSKWTTFAK